MKKTLHGKRHLRAARSVQIGRQRKRDKKYGQLLVFVKRLNTSIKNGLNGIIKFAEAMAKMPIVLNDIQINALMNVGKVAEAQRKILDTIKSQDVVI